MVIRSIREALNHTDVDPASPRTLLVLGTTIASIEELGDIPEHDGSYLVPGLSGKKVADCLGFVNTPITVSTACISGGTAQMVADRLIASGAYDNAVVCWADAVAPFDLAGFTAFKALSPMECRPFDIERLGFNLGEAAATVILGKNREADADAWRLVDGCLNNDAYHVSAPIPSGDGVSRALKGVLTDELKEALACLTAHGTATMFNDQMESKGIANAELGEIPVTAYKSNFGHTFGASGIVEAIITMCSLDEGLILPIRGFAEMGVSGKITPCTALQKTDKRAFIKVQSAFGSSNGALAYSKTALTPREVTPAQYETLKHVVITPEGLQIDRQSVPVESKGAELITELFKKFLADGSRFFKMDLYSRLAYVASGLLALNTLEDCEPEKRALCFFTLNGSLLADRKHLSTFADPDAYYPSPAVFINTLPNVVLGEIAVSYSIKGETTLVMLPERDEGIIESVVGATLDSTAPQALICGWVDCPEENSFVADLKLIKIKQ